VLALLAASSLAAAAARADDKQVGLDQALRDNAPVVIKYLRDKGYKNVGVLKFLAQVGDKAALSDNLGPINRNLADRLEVALILANPDENLGIIARATDVVAKNGWASQLTKRGRRAMFREGAGTYTLAWGGGKAVEPDAFVTGELRLSGDLRSVHVKVLAFDRNTGETMDPVCEFKAVTEMRTLTDAGVSFGARGQPIDELLALNDSKSVPTPEDPVDVWQQKVDAFLNDLERSPVRLDVLYGGKRTKVQGNSARPPSEQANVFLRVAEPDYKNDKVTFRLTNTDLKETYGVVLMINGLNTIFHEKGEPKDCFKWILKPKESIVVDGWQTKETKRAPFVVQATQKSEADKMNYGDDPGTFTFVVFRARTPKEEEVLVKAELKRDANLTSISRGMVVNPGETRNRDLESLKSDLRQEAKEAAKTATSKGIIGWDKEVPAEVQRVDFKPCPKPELSVTIRYCDPK
jgi:hypothetical protein